MLSTDEKLELRKQVESMSDKELHEYTDSFKKNSALASNCYSRFRGTLDTNAPGMFKLMSLELNALDIICLDLPKDPMYRISFIFKPIEGNLSIKNYFSIPNISYHDEKTKNETLLFLDAYSAILSNQKLLNEIRLNFLSYHGAHERLDYIQKYAKIVIKRREYNAQMLLAC